MIRIGLYVDTHLGIGHITAVSLWPSWQDSGDLGSKIALAGAHVFDEPAPSALVTA